MLTAPDITTFATAQNFHSKRRTDSRQEDDHKNPRKDVAAPYGVHDTKDIQEKRQSKSKHVAGPKAAEAVLASPPNDLQGAQARRLSRAMRYHSRCRLR